MTSPAATLDRPRRAELADEVRRFVADNPADALPHNLDERFAWLVDYQRRQHAAGLAVPVWPKRFGGRGVALDEAIVVLEELGRARSPELINFVAVEVLAPALMAFVDEARLTQWLPPMASADVVWCQLFSEPDAGSDLASLRTKAVADGDGWVVNGRKVWSTWAQFAEKGVLLARTGAPDSRHRGISAFVLDMKHPGIEVRPLVTMTGAAEFAEVTFDDVPIGPESLVGEVDRGWSVALHVLANERGPYALRRAAVLRAAMEGVREMARRSSSRSGRARTVDAHIAMWLLDRRIATVAADLEAGRPPGEGAPITKMAMTMAEQAVYNAAQDLLGLDGVTGLDDGWAEGWLYSRAASIYGGSAEIQRNVIGERILGLPPEPLTDLTEAEPGPAGPLVGVKVLELGLLVAGPLAGSIMADLGADVVHIEPPGEGDPARDVGPRKDGVALWWKVGARNKRSVTIDLGVPEGRDLARRLVAWADVVIANFRPTTLERWKLDFASLRVVNPTVIMLQVSAFGATGPKRDAGGFGKIGEALSGAAHLTGWPDGPPAFSGFLLSDATAALMGVVAVEAALYRRAQDPGFAGEWVDVALFEPLFRMIDWQVPSADQLGVPPQRAGNDSSIAETSLLDTFLTGDNEWIVVSCGTARAVERAAALVGGPDAADRQGVKGAMATWVSTRSTADALAAFEAAEVAASRIYSAADILADPVYAARGDIVTIDDPELGPLRMPAALPHLRETPGRVWRAAPSIGQDNEVVLRRYLGLGDDEIDALARAGAIGRG